MISTVSSSTLRPPLVCAAAALSRGSVIRRLACAGRVVAQRRRLSSKKNSVSWVTDSQQPLASPPDAIVVLAGGLTPSGGLPEWVTRRLDAAADLYIQASPRPTPILCLGAGTPHKPPVLGPTKYVIHEATSCASYLLAKGIPSSDILKETCSYDTVGNAYFSLTVHAIPAAWRRLAVVTSDFHMPRTRELFSDMYSIAGESLFAQPDWFQLSYWPVSDEGIFEPHILQARVDKEAGSARTWKRALQQHNISSLRDLHAWLHATHLCYSVSRQHEFGQPTELSPELAASY